MMSPPCSIWKLSMVMGNSPTGDLMSKAPLPKYVARTTGRSWQSKRMKDEKRKRDARERAELYAPRPVSSVLMYGVVGVATAGLALVSFARFYDLEALAHPVWVAVALLSVFVASMGLWYVRNRRHRTAYRHEYDKDGRE
jgi:hypothetical protein